jgi:[protein-PII] uridylyltransferase
MLLTADRPSVKSPYFDPVALRHELTALFRAHGNDAGAARPAVLDRLKRLLKNAHAAAQVELDADGKGRHCAEGLSHFQDELIRLAYDYTKAHIGATTRQTQSV